MNFINWRKVFEWVCILFTLSVIFTQPAEAQRIFANDWHGVATVTGPALSSFWHWITHPNF